MGTTKYIVIWMQNHAMRPVAEVRQAGEPDPIYKTGVSPGGSVTYSKVAGTGGALQFNDEDAQKVRRQIRTLYGNGQHVEIIQADPAQGEWTQDRLDSFLPAWAWIKKYKPSLASA